MSEVTYLVLQIITILGLLVILGLVVLFLNDRFWQKKNVLIGQFPRQLYQGAQQGGHSGGLDLWR